jgi:hypothetical protein
MPQVGTFNSSFEEKKKKKKVAGFERGVEMIRVFLPPPLSKLVNEGPI